MSFWDEEVALAAYTDLSCSQRGLVIALGPVHVPAHTCIIVQHSTSVHPWRAYF